MFLVIKDFGAVWRRALAAVDTPSMRGVGTKMGTVIWGSAGSALAGTESQPHECAGCRTGRVPPTGVELVCELLINSAVCCRIFPLDENHRHGRPEVLSSSNPSVRLASLVIAGYISLCANDAGHCNQFSGPSR